jgi:hypothetical protein
LADTFGSFPLSAPRGGDGNKSIEQLRSIAGSSLATSQAIGICTGSRQASALLDASVVLHCAMLPCKQLREKILIMRPENKSRRTIIREWMSLPREKRQTGEQAAAFALNAIEKHGFRCSGDRQRRVMAWLMPRIGKS